MVRQPLHPCPRLGTCLAAARTAAKQLHSSELAGVSAVIAKSLALTSVYIRLHERIYSYIPEKTHDHSEQTCSCNRYRACHFRPCIAELRATKRGSYERGEGGGHP